MFYIQIPINHNNAPFNFCEKKIIQKETKKAEPNTFLKGR
jgi:hypothetical protein